MKPAQLILPLLLACSPSSPTPPAASPEAPAPAAPHEGTTHAYAATHGGEVQTSGDLHVETRVMPEGAMVWLADASGKALPVEGWTGKATFAADGKVQEVALHPMGDHLHAAAALTYGKPARLVLVMEHGGKAYSVSYDVGAVGLSTHDHTSLHGGFVAMHGDHHVEWSPRSDTQRFFVTDARRAPVTADVRGMMEEDGKTVELRFDASSGALEAPSVGAGTRPVTLRLTVKEQSIELRFAPDMLKPSGEGKDHGH
jgi:hypothetical protein